MTPGKALPAGSGPATGAGPALWWAALACFVLAAASGVLLRFGFVHGLPFGLQLGDVRHAHSHLMFYSWVTPVLMILLLRQQGGEPGRGGPAIAWLALLAGVASFVPFLLSGYGRTPFLGRELPLSMMTSGLSGIAWYAFMVFWFRRRRREPRSIAATWALAAVAMLLVASLGVIALAVGGVRQAGPAFVYALAMFFLDAFAEGWFGLALLALAYGMIAPAQGRRAAVVGLAFLVAGLLLRSLGDLGVHLGFGALTPAVLIGSGLAGLGLLAALWPLGRQLLREPLSPWHIALAFLALKGVIDLLASQPHFAAWSGGPGMRVFYLHAYLLCSISIGLVAAARVAWGERAYPLPWLLVAAAVAMTASLLPLSTLWPAAWSGPGWLVAAAWASLVPPLAVLVSAVTAGRNTVEQATQRR